MTPEQRARVDIDALLCGNGRDCGLFEAKKYGATLTGVELQSSRYPQGLSCERVRPLPNALPPLAKQARIVAKVDFPFFIICKVEDDANLQRA